jgi:hypothetical protein
MTESNRDSVEKTARDLCRVTRRKRDPVEKIRCEIMNRAEQSGPPIKQTSSPNQDSVRASIRAGMAIELSPSIADNHERWKASRQRRGQGQDQRRLIR